MNQNKIYVGNLAYETTEDSLREAFTQYGRIDDLVLIKDRDTGRSKGFGFITFDSQQAAEAALKMDAQQLDGRAIKVNIAKERERSGGGGGGGGAGGGRGRW